MTAVVHTQILIDLRRARAMRPAISIDATAIMTMTAEIILNLHML
jgi:hypothetical protein